MLLPHIPSILSLKASDQVWPKCNVQPALGDSCSKLFAAAINSSILVHCKTWTTSKSTFHTLTGPLSHKRVPKSIKFPAKEKETKGGEGEATCPHICHCPSVPWEAIDPHGPFAHMPSRHRSNIEDLCSRVTAWPLMFPSREEKEPCCCHPRGGEIKWNAMPSQAENMLHLFVSRAYPCAWEDARINIHFQLLAVYELISR